MSNDPSQNPLALDVVNHKYPRSEIGKLEKNVNRILNKNPEDEKALAVRKAIETTYLPSLENEYVFVGFCLGATLEGRLDEQWIENSVCILEYYENEAVVKRFSEIRPGDIVILKKREVFGKTMRLFSHGRVKETKVSKVDKPYFLIDWITPNEFLEVPLMGCNTTVDVRSLEDVDTAMPKEFWQWLAIETDGESLDG